MELTNRPALRVANFSNIKITQNFLQKPTPSQ